MGPGADQFADRTIVANPRWIFGLIWIGLPIFGGGLGWLLKSIAGWVATLPWAPMQGPFKLVATFPEPHATIGALIIGALAGLILAYFVVREDLQVDITDDRAILTRLENSLTIERPAVAAAFLDGKHLVILGHSAEELAREITDLGADILGDAFIAHRYPWRAEGDPHKDEFRRWVEGLPDLPPSADPIFKARAKALEKGDDNDAAQLRSELARLGVVVRDEKKRQFWRLSGIRSEVPSESERW